MPPPRAILFAACLFAFFGVGWICCGLALNQTGWDFPQFYIAARAPTHSLYDRAVFEDVARKYVAPAGVKYFPPYVRPAVFSLPLRLLMWPGYRAAFSGWVAVQVAFLVLSVALLWRGFPAIPGIVVGSLGLLFPAMFGLITGQDANTELVILTLGFTLLCSGRKRAAGLVLGLAVYKFNLVLLVPVFLLVRRQYTSLLWFSGAAVALATASALLASPASYLELLTHIERYTIGFSPDRMLGLRSLVYAAGAPWLFWIVAPCVAVLAAWAMRVLPMAEAFSVAVLSSLLCAWHAGWYDATLLIFPMMVASRARGATARKLIAAALLIVPIWIFLPRLSTLLLLALWLAFLVAAREQESAMGVGD
jgi:hypothetical protein